MRKCDFSKFALDINVNTLDFFYKQLIYKEVYSVLQND